MRVLDLYCGADLERRAVRYITGGDRRRVRSPTAPLTINPRTRAMSQIPDNATRPTALERWLPVVGFEGSYEVSDLGRVRSLDRLCPYERVDQYSGRVIKVHRRRRGQLLRPGRKSSGHLSVALGRGGSRDVHRLVLEAFVGPCPDGQEALHEDDNPDRNCLTNLRWGTRSENLKDAIRNGKKPIGERVWSAKLRDVDIPVIRRRLATERANTIAADFRVSETAIRQVRDGRAWRNF